MKSKIFITLAAMALWAAVLVAASNSPTGKANSSCCPPTPGCPCYGICK